MSVGAGEIGQGLALGAAGHAGSIGPGLAFLERDDPDGGHGLGLDIHESPSLSKEDKNKIEEDIVFTIEPGIYFSNKYGIRIEDTLTLKNKKIKILTKSKKDLIIIKKKK